MKKQSFLCLLMFGLSAFGYSQTLSSPATAVASGSTVTITASGESASAYFSSIRINPAKTVSTSPDIFGTNYVSIGFEQNVRTYDIALGTPTQFTIEVKNNHPTNEYTMKVTCDVTISNMQGLPPKNMEKVFTIKIKPQSTGGTPGDPGLPPGQFGNKALYKVFYKNNCPSGYSSNFTFGYSIRANAYVAETQEKADRLATEDLEKNGQRIANNGDGCKLIYVKFATPKYFNGTVGGSPTIWSDMRIDFYEDAGGTKPLRVNNLNVNFEVTKSYIPTGQYIPIVNKRTRTVTATGTQHLFRADEFFTPGSRSTTLKYKLAGGSYIIIN